MEVKLLHLYSDIMNLYGEYGNMKLLEQHLKDQGFEVVLDKKTINDEIKFDDYDFIYVGSGTEKNQQVILADMLKYKEDLKNIIEKNKVLLFTGNSYEILGKTINGKEALHIFEFETENTTNRITEDIIATSSILKNKVVGFINNMSSIKNNNQPLFNIEFGVGENKESKQEGIIYKNLIGTHLIGPILERNPEILQLIIEKIGKNKDEKFEYKQIEYIEEENGYKLVLQELENRKNA